ncbi:uncharacterized protein Z518_05416 [Rhinocladiella mackenziei CBS 650.93]|uniref:DOMON domain-containing protein n=1 Tax=Rhinocladiella mackenziei CBS 650.93 TaxID=1442369 RepID=A0A0D2IN52_9EURO|nr:uncharacterized protein Z518_05416 [Rhinocladiella mackenziei CBS 650.93]KIX04546.1 hypothetical protein Z518_05416 [Rhinocladiella mackenziei CBS 650.93]
MSFVYQSRIRVLLPLFVTTFFLTAQAAVPESTYVGLGTSRDTDDNVTVAINVPSDSTDSLFFYFSAPAGQEWAAFGLGGQMDGALMFVTYANDDGNNITLSPRLGTGHVEPKYTSDVKVDVLNGSGIIDGTFVVNAKCTGCRSWNGGSIDINSEDQDMIWAVGPVGDMNSNDVSATIVQHQGYASFELNLKKATGTGGVPVPSADEVDYTRPGDGGLSRGGVAFHAFLMVAAYLVVFPTGYLVLRFFEKVWLHWGVQSFAFLMVVIGTGVGIAVSKRDNLNPSLDSVHQILGLVVTGLVLLTWTVGFIGHRIYKKTGAPAKIMKGHRVLGPSTIAFGLINSFIGFNFADNNRRGMILLAIAIVLMLTFIGTVLFFKRRRQVRKGPLNTPAAANFREGQMEPGYADRQHPQSLPLYGQGGIPLQNYANTPPVYR